MRQQLMNYFFPARHRLPWRGKTRKAPKKTITWRSLRMNWMRMNSCAPWPSPRTRKLKRPLSGGDFLPGITLRFTAHWNTLYPFDKEATLWCTLTTLYENLWHCPHHYDAGRKCRTRPINQINQSIIHSFDQPINQSNNQSNNQSSCNQSINQSNNQSIIVQSINQSINGTHWVIWFIGKISWIVAVLLCTGVSLAVDFIIYVSLSLLQRSELDSSVHFHHVHDRSVLLSCLAGTSRADRLGEWLQIVLVRKKEPQRILSFFTGKDFLF